MWLSTKWRLIPTSTWSATASLTPPTFGSLTACLAVCPAAPLAGGRDGDAVHAGHYGTRGRQPSEQTERRRQPRM